VRAPGRSHERIYQHVRMNRRLGGELHRALRCRKGKRKRYPSGRERRRRAQGPSLSARLPAVAATRRYGGWELDTVHRRRCAAGW
jgi:IS30 family transposase